METRGRGIVGKSRLHHTRPPATLGYPPLANPQARGGHRESNAGRRITLDAEGPTERRTHVGHLFGDRRGLVLLRVSGGQSTQIVLGVTKPSLPLVKAPDKLGQSI